MTTVCTRTCFYSQPPFSPAAAYARTPPLCPCRAHHPTTPGQAAPAQPHVPPCCRRTLVGPRATSARAYAGPGSPCTHTIGRPAGGIGARYGALRPFGVFSTAFSAAIPSAVAYAACFGRECDFSASEAPRCRPTTDAHFGVWLCADGCPGTASLSPVLPICAGRPACHPVGFDRV